MTSGADFRIYGVPNSTADFTPLSAAGVKAGYRHHPWRVLCNIRGAIQLAARLW